MKTHTAHRTRWAAIGAAVAVTLGAGGVGISSAMIDSGERAVYTPIEPCRMLDTRANQDVAGRKAPLQANEAHTLTVTNNNGKCAAIQGATGLALNVTPVGPTVDTYLSFVPGRMTPPSSGVYSESSNLNPSPSQPPTPNAVEVALDDQGRFSVYNAFGSVHVVIDVVGYYADHNHDDRYFQKSETYDKDQLYTADEVDDLVREAIADAARVESPLKLGPIELADHRDTDLVTSSAWLSYDTGEGGQQCAYAIVDDLPVGAVVTELHINAATDGAASGSTVMFVASLSGEPGSLAAPDLSDRIRWHFVSEQHLPDTPGFETAERIVRTPSASPPQPFVAVGPGDQPLLALCLEQDIKLAGIEVHFDTP